MATSADNVFTTIVALDHPLTYRAGSPTFSLCNSKHLLLWFVFWALFLLVTCGFALGASLLGALETSSFVSQNVFSDRDVCRAGIDVAVGSYRRVVLCLLLRVRLYYLMWKKWRSWVKPNSLATATWRKTRLIVKGHLEQRDQTAAAILMPAVSMTSIPDKSL